MHRLYVFGVCLGLAACGAGVEGEAIIGRPGSNAWTHTASPATQMAYFTTTCLNYGFKPETPQMAYCLDHQARDAQRKSALTGLSALIMAAPEQNRY